MANLIPYIAIWAVLAIVITVLYVYRRSIAKQEDETLHVLEAEAAALSQQAVVAKKLEVVDRWGKILTVVEVLYSLALAGLYVYNSWLASTKTVL